MEWNETGFVRVAGADLEYRMIGPLPGAAPTIVLLHEGLGCVSLWKDFPDRLAAHHGDNVDCAFWGWNRAWLDPGFRHWDIQDFLPRIEMPVLIVQGQGDQYGTAGQIAAAQEKCAGPVSVALLPDCRHSPHRDQPDRTLAAATAFIAPLLRHSLAGSPEPPY